MSLFLLDVSTIIALDETCAVAAEDVHSILAKMTDLAISGDLLCPTPVIQSCKVLAANETPTRWLITVYGHFRQLDDSWEFMEMVMTRCPGLLDPDSQEDSPQASVLSLAMSILASGTPDVIVVTDDWSDSKLRLSVGSAANNLSLNTLTVEAFVKHVALL